MATIGALKKRLEKVDVGFISSESIDQTKQTIILLQQAQLFQGLTSEEHPIHRIGKPASYIYADRTIREKRRKGQPVDRVTLRDTMDFYKDMFVDVREETWVTDSGNFKAAFLLKDYGVTIFGLGRKRKTEYVQDTLKTTFVRNIKTAAGL